MSESENILQKAFYLGVGVAIFVAEKANDAFSELKQQADKLALNQDFPSQLQKMADEMVEKGKMNADEARKLVDEIIKQNQENGQIISEEDERKPRKIEIIMDDDDDDD